MAPRFRIAERSTRLECPAERVWEWLAAPGALERLTPPWLPARVVARRGGLENGATVELRLRVGPVPVRWLAVHRDVEPGRGFRDEQLDGPFEHWAHVHAIEPDGPGACVYTDRIEYLPPFGALGLIGDRHGIADRIARLLAYRHAVLAGDLAAHGRWRGAGALCIAVTGSRGMIGSALVPYLSAGGHRVRRVVRGAARAGDIAWDPAAGRLDARALDGVDAVIHLAGENLAARRWTPARKQRLLESRSLGTRTLAEAIARTARPPAVLVSASAIGVYGDRGDDVLDERSPTGEDFLAELCRQWERATGPARDAGVRVVHPRMGVVLSPRGGALARMVPAFRAGGGARLGSGRQWMSVVSIDDVLGALHHLLMHGGAAGPANVVAPEPVRNADFTVLLARHLRRPAFVGVPRAALRAAFGEMAVATLLASQRALPRALEAAGYRFRHPTADAALTHVLGTDGAGG